MKRLLRLFRFSGRAGIVEFWAVNLLVWPVAALASAELRAMTTVASGVFLLVLVIALAELQISVCVRRLHDRGKTGWWVLVFVGLPAAVSFVVAAASRVGAPATSYLPAVVLSLWGWAEMGFLPAGARATAYGAAPVD